MDKKPDVAHDSPREHHNLRKGHLMANGSLKRSNKRVRNKRGGIVASFVMGEADKAQPALGPE